MKKLITLITTATLFLSSGLLNTVAAQECPYGICVPRTDIIVGDLVIDSITLSLLALFFLIGVIALMVSSLLRQELYAISNK